MKTENPPCPHCGRYAATRDALAAVTLHRRPWGAAPTPRLGGSYAALQDLVAAGYATRDAAGWYIPTDLFPTPQEA